MAHDLAQVNIARLAAELTDPRLADFVTALEPVNALADAADGFVWRLQTEAGDATSVVAFESEVGDGVGVITNLSTWRDVEALSEFVFRTAHADVMRRRREFFLPIEEAYTVCWWVPSGHRPTVEEAEERLDLLRRNGPTPEAFTLRRSFPPPG